MRIGSYIFALFVCAAIAVFLFQRDWLIETAQKLVPAAFVAEQDEGSDTAVSPVAEDEVMMAADAASVVARKMEAQDMTSGLVLRGRTEAYRMVDVKAETSGLVISQPLRKGALVEEGQTLCQLDPGTREARLSEAEARLAEAKANNTAAARLAEQGFASETQAIARRAALEAAQAAAEAARKELDRLVINAPFAGLLESDTAELGTLLQPGAPCARVIALDPIKLVGFAAEDKIDRLHVGARAIGRLINGTELTGALSFVSRSADPQTRTYRVEVTVPNPGLEIRDGSTAEILIAFEGESAHFLPQSALTLNQNGVLGVRIVAPPSAGALANDPNALPVAQFMPVSIIRDTNEGVWVAGLPDVVDVITVGQEFVVDGRALLVTYQPQQDEAQQ